MRATTSVLDKRTKAQKSDANRRHAVAGARSEKLGSQLRTFESPMKIVPSHNLATFVGHRIANSGHPDLVQSYGKWPSPFALGLYVIFVRLEGVVWRRVPDSGDNGLSI